MSNPIKQLPPPLPVQSAIMMPAQASCFTYVNQPDVSESDDDLSCLVCLDIFTTPVDHSTCGMFQVP